LRQREISIATDEGPWRISFDIDPSAPGRFATSILRGKRPRKWEEQVKRLVVSCDGTWNDTDNQSTDTNVFRIARSIHASQGTGGILQIVLYLRGVGTSGLKIETIVEGAVGLGVDET
jgi:uncharacterized protein (DUF2235 family)